MGIESEELWNAMKQVKYRETSESITKTILSANGDIDNAIANTLNIVCKAVHSEAGTFWFYNSRSDGFIRARASFGGSDLSNVHLNIGEGIAGKVIETGNAEMISDCKNNRKWSSSTDSKSGFDTKSMICVPLKYNSIIFGCIQLINKTDNSLFDESDFDLVEHMANEISNKFVKQNLLLLGETKDNVAISFIKIKNFAEIIQNHSPSTIAEMLNSILSYVGDFVSLNNGIVDKYVNDETIAYWNNDERNNAYDACKNAFDILNNCKELQNEFKDKYSIDINFCISVSYGEVYIGNIGSKQLMDYTCVGKTVNGATYLIRKCPENKIFINKECKDILNGYARTTKNSGLFVTDKYAIESYQLDYLDIE